MELTDSKGRPVEVDEIDGEIGEGAYAVSGIYMDTPAEAPFEYVSDDELEWISDAHQEHLYDQLYQRYVGAAEDWADSMADR